VIRFKQGVGRLIRSRRDTGRVVVLDPRIVTTSYGRAFLAALPAGVTIEHARAAPPPRREERAEDAELMGDIPF
jgi:Rad3-related DNA helicase